MKKRFIVLVITSCVMLISILSVVSAPRSDNNSKVIKKLFTCHETDGFNEELNTFDCDPCAFTNTYPTGEATTCEK